MATIADSELSLVIHGTQEMLEQFCFRFPIQFFFSFNMQQLNHILKQDEQHIGRKKKIVKGFFLVLLTAVDQSYQIWLEENSQVVAVFCPSDNGEKRKFSSTKFYSFPTKSFPTAISFSIIRLIESQAKIQDEAGNKSLAAISNRRIEAIRNWLMSYRQAEPSDVLVISLNTNEKNVKDTINRLDNVCFQLGYEDVVINQIKEYVPSDEIYEKLPYGKELFQFEDPALICSWLRRLCPIRIYLYGNESKIVDEWSELMIQHETEPSEKNLINDDDFFIFLENENEPIADEVKWNFSAKYALKWPVKNFYPVNIKSLPDNIRFQSALRNVYKTYDDRSTLITAKLLNWYENSIRAMYFLDDDLYNESRTAFNRRDTSGYLMPRYENELTLDEKDRAAVTRNARVAAASTSSEPTITLNNQCYPRSKLIYVWLDDRILPDQRFESIIAPKKWNCYSNIFECQRYVSNQIVHREQFVILVASATKAEEFLGKAEPHSNIIGLYLYSTIERPPWVYRVSNIQAFQPSIDDLYEKFKTHLVPINQPIVLQNNDYNVFFTPFLYLTHNPTSWKVYREFTEFIESCEHDNSTFENIRQDLNKLFLDGKISSKEKQDFLEHYHPDSTVTWYTQDNLLSVLMKRALKEMVLSELMSFRFLIADLSKAIRNQYEKDRYKDEEKVLRFYRGQRIILEEFEKLKSNIGTFMFNKSFLSTSKSASVASRFTGIRSNTLEQTTTVSVIFSISAVPSERYIRPFAHISNLSAFKDEEEILFVPGSVFRIDNVDRLSGTTDTHVIHCQLVSQNELDKLKIREREWGSLTYSLYCFKSYFETTAILNEQLIDALKNVNINLSYFDENVDQLELEMISKTPRRIFVPDGIKFSNKNNENQVIPYRREEFHPFDLIYTALDEISAQSNNEKALEEAYDEIHQILRRSEKKRLYIQLFHKWDDKIASENRFIRDFPSLPSISFYQPEKCLTFLRSKTRWNSNRYATLLIRSNEPKLDDVVRRFTELDAIENIYVCSKSASTLPDYPIIKRISTHEDQLFFQLTADQMYQSFCQTYEEIPNEKNIQQIKKQIEHTETLFQSLVKAQKDIVTDENPA